MSAACKGPLLLLSIAFSSFLAVIFRPAIAGKAPTVRAGDGAALPVIVQAVCSDLSGPVAAQGDEFHQIRAGQQFRMILLVIFHKTDPERILIKSGEDGVYGADALFSRGVIGKDNIGEELRDLLLKSIPFDNGLSNSL